MPNISKEELDQLRRRFNFLVDQVRKIEEVLEQATKLAENFHEEGRKLDTLILRLEERQQAAPF